MKQSPEQLLARILNCGSADIPYILELEEGFDVDINIDNLKEEGLLNANSIIQNIFEQALDNAANELGIELINDNYQIFTNCLDSHLHIQSKNDWLEVYSYSELVEALKQ
jgi:hypothetical protein